MVIKKIEKEAVNVRKHYWLRDGSTEKLETE